MIEENQELAALQEKLSSFVEIPDSGGYVPSEGDIVLALDIQYKEDQAHVAGDLHAWKKEHIGTFAGVIKADVPYVSSYFCFREGPPLLALIEKLAQESLPQPDIIVVDGHGIAHPRCFGVACWVGVATVKPTIGCAKDTLLRYEGDLAEPSGSTIDVVLEEKVVGHVLRTQDGVKPIYVSPGHLVSLEMAQQIALQLPGPYRISDPIRRADQAARAHCKGLQEANWKDLGTLEKAMAHWERE